MDMAFYIIMAIAAIIAFNYWKKWLDRKHVVACINLFSELDDKWHDIATYPVRDKSANRVIVAIVPFPQGQEDRLLNHVPKDYMGFKVLYITSPDIFRKMIEVGELIPIKGSVERSLDISNY